MTYKETWKLFQPLVASKEGNIAFVFLLLKSVIFQISFWNGRMNHVLKFSHVWQICNSWVLPASPLLRNEFSLIGSWSKNYNKQNITAMIVCLTFLWKDVSLQTTGTWAKLKPQEKKSQGVVLLSGRLQKLGQRKEGSIWAPTPELCLTTKLLSILSMAHHQHARYALYMKAKY